MKYIPYGKHNICAQDIEEVVRVLKSDWITQGKLLSNSKKNYAIPVMFNTLQ